MDNLLGSLRYYNFREALSLYLKLKNSQIASISTSKLSSKVYFRPGSTDRCVFKQIFLKQDLNIPVLNTIQPKTILDLGANIGMSSLYLINEFPEASIIAVEPDKQNGEMFKKNLVNHGSVEFILAAVRGDNKKISIVDNGKGESGYEVIENNNGSPAMTIADIMERSKWQQVDVIKMDIEGSEKSVFEGDVDMWLPNTKVLFVELHEHKVPGCTRALSNALSMYNFTWSKSGEYEVLINQDLN